MNKIQSIIIVTFGIVTLIVFLKSIYQSFIKKNPFGQFFPLFFLGIFVWGDAVILGFFWFIVSLISFLLKDWVLFLLIISVFWTIRSFGEILYWINQQFSPIIRNPPSTLMGYRFFKNDSIWFIYQLFWQCIMVVSIICSIFLIRL